jgi:hypothetical protein
MRGAVGRPPARIPDGLEVDTTMRLDGCAEQHDVPLDGVRHRLAVAFPERSTALDVGEEEGNCP